MNAPGMHCSGPRPKLHRGDPSFTSSAIFWGVPQERCAVPAGELPLGAQCTARYWLFTVGVFPFWKLTTTSPVGRTATSECPLKLQLLGSNVLLKKSPNWQICELIPLISSGVDQVNPWSVDIDA